MTNLECTITFHVEDPNKSITSNCKTTFITRPDENKKSVYWLDEGPYEGEGDCLLLSASSKSTFFLGGFQILSNAKMIEVYLTTESSNDQYLMTCRGIPSEGLFKILCVVPGGPRPVNAVRLKIFIPKNDADSDSKVLHVRSAKFTARVPEHKTVSENIDNKRRTNDSTIPSLLSQVPPMPSPASNQSIDMGRRDLGSSSLLTREDLGSALSAITFTARKTEDRVLEKIGKIEETVSASNQLLLEAIKSQQLMLEEQQKILSEQASQIKLLVLEQAFLKELLVNRGHESAEGDATRSGSLVTSEQA